MTDRIVAIFALFFRIISLCVKGAILEAWTVDFNLRLRNEPFELTKHTAFYTLNFPNAREGKQNLKYSANFQHTHLHHLNLWSGLKPWHILACFPIFSLYGKVGDALIFFVEFYSLDMNSGKWESLYSVLCTPCRLLQVI